MSRAQPADEHTYARYHNLVEGLCIASGLPEAAPVHHRRPRTRTRSRPAATRKHAAIAVTTGLLEKMNRVELEGVLAHELSHIRNYDILVMTLAVTMVGIIALALRLLPALHVLGRRPAADDDDRNNPVGAIIAIVRRRAA